MATIIVVGSGGREHALAWKLSQSPQVDKVYVLPGNPRMASDKVHCVAIKETDFTEIIHLAKEKAVTYVVVGPEMPLSLGLVDALIAAGIRTIGPSQAAAQLETSKAFAKEVMAQAEVPTGRAEVFESYRAARLAVSRASYPLVLKDDALKAGKGVTIATDFLQAEAALAEIFSHSEGRVLLEEYLVGEEFSVFTLVGAGDSMIPLGVAQDHKRAYEGDRGPNTGGMGAYTPVPQIPKETIAEVYERVVKPVVQKMTEIGLPYRGVLYCGMMLTADGIRVIEFNARFGDPECQVILSHLKSDLHEIFLASLNGKTYDVQFKDGLTLGVMRAAEGYPNAYEKDFPLGPLTDTADVQVFASGVTTDGTGQYLAKGGRLYMPVANGPDVKTARDKVIQYLEKQVGKKTFYRCDIGHLLEGGKHD